MLSIKRHLNNAGDTIIEVLFAVAVIGIVLAGAYGVVARSILIERDAQEHSYALGLVQSQIEMLRSYVINNPSAPLLFSSAGCLYYNTIAGSVGIASIASSPKLCQTQINPTQNYSLSIVSGSTNSVYTVKASWPSVLSTTGNSGQDVIAIPYRIQPNGS